MKFFFLASLLMVAGHLNAQSLADSVELNAFMDGVMKTHLRDKHLAGASVSIVKDGQVLFSKGYGFCDLAKQRASTDTTLFRIGSISKLFIWISVMQLVHEGKLRLDVDVNTYLNDFKIGDPDHYGTPITLKNLMTHTAGFEDVIIGLFAKDSSAMKPLGQILAKEMPARVRAPGTFASYSNHGAATAAYIVEQVSGMKFHDYVENRILNPVKMHTTTFRQPLPNYLKSRMSKGYTFAGGELKEQSFEFVPLYPMGGGSSTAVDMARFMNMILNHGTYNQIEILDSATLASMETPAHQHHRDVNPMLYGFIDMSRNGVRIFGHGGDTFWFHSMLALFPESNTGVFVSFNTSDGPAGAVVEEFTDRYFPQPSGMGKKLVFQLSKEKLKQFDGSYRVNRYAYHDITTIGSLFSEVKVESMDSSKLKVSSNNEVKYYVPTDSMTFRAVGTSDVIAFKRNIHGEVSYLFLGGLPILALDKTTALGNGNTHLFILMVVAIFVVIMLFYWPITTRARRGYEPMGSVVTLPPGAKVTGWVNYFLLGVFYVGFPVVLGKPETIVYGVPIGMKILLAVPFLIILTTFVMLLQLYRIWNQRKYRLWSRVFYLMITVISVVAIWQLYYWNFIGFNY